MPEKRFTHWWWVCLLTMASYFDSKAQRSSLPLEQAIESSMGGERTVADDVDLLEELEAFRVSPLALNQATREQLSRLTLLSALQIEQLLHYRSVLGPLLHVNELQAVPGFSIELIRSLLPYVCTDRFNVKSSLALPPLKEAEHDLLFRVSGVASGSSERGLFRYRIVHRNLLAGWVGKKDPSRRQLYNGVHFFIRDRPLLKALALGDFTVNMGQGLVQWQSMAFGKTAEMDRLIRQGPVLRPYRNAGVSAHYRGAGISVQRSNKEFTLFGSFRSPAGQWAGGGRYAVRYSRLTVGINGVGYRFLQPLVRGTQPRNLFDVQGSGWANLSVDLTHTHRNAHFFGELAIDALGHRALVAGTLLSITSKADMAVVSRLIGKRYRAFYANAFTEAASPEAEQGIYLAFALRPHRHYSLSLSADHYYFSWLSYRINSPLPGRDYAAQLTYHPSKTTSLLVRYRWESKGQDDAALAAEYPITPSYVAIRQGLRVHLSRSISTRATFSARLETCRFYRRSLFFLREPLPDREQGFLLFADISLKQLPVLGSVLCRIQYFESTSYQSRIYAFEPDLRPGYSFTAWYGSGAQFLILINKSLDNNIKAALRWALTQPVQQPARHELSVQLGLKLQRLGFAKKNPII